MIYNMVHNEQDDWDLAQDSFLIAWRSVGRFRSQSSFYTWIYRMVMNVTIDSLGKNRVKDGDGEFDDALQLAQIETESKTVARPDTVLDQKVERSDLRERHA